MALKVDVDGFWRDGFTLIRGAYTPEEIEEFRKDSFAQQGKHAGDLLSNPWLSRVVTDGKQAEVARQILRRDDLVYYGDTTVAIREGKPSWHKDNADRKDAKAPDWRSDYTQLRFGIYLQDHSKHSGGLNVRVGSHNHADYTTGKCIQIQSKVGDLGVWSMRITHSAAGTLLKWAPGRNRHPDFTEVPNINPKHILPKDQQRIAIFSALGADDEHAKRYVEYLKTRKYMIPRWLGSEYTPEMVETMEKTGVQVWDMKSQVENDPNVGQNEVYKPIPY